MSGDVQPRKRKDKKRKRDFADRKSEGDITLSRQDSLQEDDESSHGVHSTKMGSDDVHLHVQEDHGTGGHWCAKLLFFILLSILVGLIGLIIMENRGLADLDTPLSESRYSNYFDGWVEERVDDHEHDAVEASIEEHEEHDEPFEEVEDHSEPTEEDADEHDEENEEHEEDDEEEEKTEIENEETEEETDNNIQDSNQQQDDVDDDNNDDDAENDQEEEEEEDQEDEENEEDNNDEDEVVTKEQIDSQEDTPENMMNDEEEEDDDGMDENSVELVENDAQEEELLQEKAKADNRNAVDSKENEDDTEADEDDVDQNNVNDAAAGATQSWASALNDSEKELLMKRRLTIATAQEEFPEDKAVRILTNNDDEEFSEVEIEIEEEIEIEDDEVEMPTDLKLQMEKELIQNKYKPETFEELNALYKSKTAEETKIINETKEKAILQTNNEKINNENQKKVDENDEDEYEEEEIEIEEVDEEDEDELLEEYEDEEEELEDEEDNSDVDDTDLLKRLEAKYGTLPTEQLAVESDDELDDSTWSQIKPKAGGQQSYDDDEVDSFERELHAANEEMMREHHENALLAYTQLSEKYPNQPEIILALANALDKVAEKQRSNVLLKKALETFQHYLSFGTKVNDQDFRDVAKLCIKRMRFLGYLMPSIQVHKQIMARFSLEAWPRNDLAVTYLLMNRMAEAKLILKETLRHWPNNGFALVHYGFVLKQLDMDYEQAVVYLERGIASEEPGTQDGRFYFNLGDALQRLGRNEEALKVYDKGASLGLFPSRYQRSLYNEPNLRAKPFWSKNETSYEVYLKRFEQNWQAIKIEGLNLLSKDNYFKNESENLRQTGDWKQFELYVRGQQIKQNCQKAPITCSLISDFPAARDCRRGQIKFSVIHPNTHVWPHCGPTNCRLRAHLGLVVPPGLRLRVAEEENLWKEGEFIIFDDSFEHEVWHNGNSSRLVLIIDLWHPDLSKKQREQLAAI